MTGPQRTWKGELTLAASRWRLFFSSYAPVFIIAAIRFHGLVLRSVCAVIAVSAILDTLRMLRVASQRTEPRRIVVDSTDDAGSEVGGYLVSYLLPFVTVGSPEAADVVGYALFLLVALIVFVRTDLVRVNPTLYVLGYKVIRVRYGQEQQYLITRLDPEIGEPLSVTILAGVFVATGSERA